MAFTQGRAKIRGKAHQNLAEADRLEAGGSDPKNWKVEQVAQHLERLIGPDRYFYDRNYTAQLARPSLDTFLQAVYRERSRMVVVFSGGDYQLNDWCGIEFRAVREIINAREHDRIMFVRMDDGEVEGIFGHDGYVDARLHNPAEVATFIEERVGLRIPGRSGQ